MRYLTDGEEMKRADKDTIERIGIPSLVLMERAAVATAEEIRKRVPTPGKVLAICGCGNNGGDGFAVGRILQEYGYQADYVLTGSLEKCSRETLTQMNIIRNLGNLIWIDRTPEQLQTEHDLTGYDVLIDAIFGIGLSREVKDLQREWIRWINGCRNGENPFVCSVDIPSGIHSGNGSVLGDAVRADLTVTYGYAKLGQYLYPGTGYCGELAVSSIGIPVRGETAAVFALEKKDIKDLLPKRDPSGNKGGFGKVLVIAGSKNMSGACQFTAKAAYRMGAGLVRILTPEANRCILQSTIPEAILTTYEEEGVSESIWREALEWPDCVVIGPGIGMSECAGRWMGYVLEHCEKTLIVDADGLNHIANHPEWMGTVSKKNQIIFTPHVGEFSRLSGKSIVDIKEHAQMFVKNYAAEHKVIFACKDARTWIASPEGALALNTSGCDAMATGGSGDVLAGMIAGLLAQKADPYLGTVLGCYLHGLAGEIASQKKNAFAVMASDILDGIGALDL